MRLSYWIAVVLGLHYLVLGFAYALTSHFVAGFPLLMMAALGMSLFGAYAFSAVRRGERDLAARKEAVDPMEPHVGSTIWPFGYSLSAVGIVLGFLAYRPLWALGGVLFIASTAGWYHDVRHQWRHVHEEPPPPGPPLGPDTTPMPGEGLV